MFNAVLYSGYGLIVAVPAVFVSGFIAVRLTFRAARREDSR